MANSRSSADDRSNMNKLYRPIANYASNVVKEIKDNVSTWSQGQELGYKIRTYPESKRPALKAQATANDKKATAERGQLAGAIFKGARYDNKGNRK